MRQKKPKQEPKKLLTSYNHKSYLHFIMVNILLSSFLGKMLGLSLTSLALNLLEATLNDLDFYQCFKNANTIVLMCPVQYELFFLTKDQLK